MGIPLALAAYLIASRLAGPLARPILARRAARGREDPARLGERLGHPSAPRPEGRLVWLHAASLGEALSVVPLAAELSRPPNGLACLVTTGTVSAARRMAAVLPDCCVHQYAPVDTASAVRRFLDHWRPDLAVWVESEFWPRLMVETAWRGTPMALVNARLSARSFRRWQRVPRSAARLLRLFQAISAQDPCTVSRLAALGADPARSSVSGNLKALSPPPGCDEAELGRLGRLIGGRPVWLAASTHAAEEKAVAEAHRFAAKRLQGLLTIVAPRHPERGASIAAQMAASGLTCARRSAGVDPGAGTAVLLADSFGEMGLWYRLAPVTFVGGSLAPHGGHTPYEPAGLGSAIVFGPHTDNFGPAYAELARAKAACRIADGAALGQAVAVLLSDPKLRAAMAEAARAVCLAQAPDIASLAARLITLMEGRGESA